MEQFVGAALRGFAIETIHSADEIQIFGASEALKQSHAFGNDADLAFHRDRIGGKIHSKEPNCGPTSEPTSPVSILIVVDFPAPFGPRKPKNCPAVDGEIDAVNRGESAKGARQILSEDCGFVHLLAVGRGDNWNGVTEFDCSTSSRGEMDDWATREGATSREFSASAEAVAESRPPYSVRELAAPREQREVRRGIRRHRSGRCST